MKDSILYIYRNLEFDGNIYIKITGAPPEQQCNITLYKNGNAIASLNGEVAAFNNQSEGRYMAIASLIARDGATTRLQSRELNIPRHTKTARKKLKPTTKATKEIYTPYKNIDHYYLQIKLDNKDGINHLKNETATKLPLFFQVKDRAFYMKIPDNKLLGEILPNTYQIDPHREFDELVEIANELEQLDYVVYCSVMPDTSNMSPPDSTMLGNLSTPTDSADTAAITPDFQALQTYLPISDINNKGMNIVSAWQRGETGRAATVRHLDFGIYRNHEDLKGNITVITSRPETEDCNHGTASTGCIAAINNNIGVTGIAHSADFYFYDTDDLPLIVRDAVPGDIVSLDIQFHFGDTTFLPVIHDRGWWDMIYALTQRGVVVVLAAGNGGLDLSQASGNMNQFGNSGSILIGSCHHDSGRKSYYSNYHHVTSLMNSWGESVVTTGYGSLYAQPGNDRNYIHNYGGTSAATPLCSGALALIQSYTIDNFGIYLNWSQIQAIIGKTGYSEAVSELVGHRPNVDAALSALLKQLDGS